jgi:uncharacterized protein YfaS (alpha-2-macroglobulin family)
MVMRHFTNVIVALIVVSLAANVIATPTASATPTWRDVTATIMGGRLETAIVKIEEILADARAREDAHDWTRALIERRALRSALDAPETAARQLREAAWPADPACRAILELHWADALSVYHRAYSYEIRQRETVAEADSLDLKAWSHDRFGREIDLALHRAWSTRAQWGDEPLAAWATYLEPNSYPTRIRGTLRDAVTYARIEHLADSSLWPPRTSTAVLDVQFLLELAARRSTELAAVLADSATHPVHKIVLLAADLRAWHLAHDRDEAALEAELESLRRVRQAVRDPDDQIRIRQHLETRLGDLDADEPWWSLGQWQLARFLEQENTPDRLVRAHLAAARGAARHPESVGGRFCAAVVEAIERPAFSLGAMTTDAPQRRTIAIEHRNLERLHFRAWRWDLAAHWADGTTTPTSEEIRALVYRGGHDLAWVVDLPQTEDYDDHRTWTGLPACHPGGYIVVASTSPEFVAEEGSLQAVSVLISDIVATVQTLDEAVEIVVRDGRRGRPVPEAEVALRSRRGDPHDGEITRLRTGADGRVRHPIPRNRSLTALVTHGDDLAILPSVHGRHGHHRDPPVRCFLYTDRAVYRPGQTVHWKLVAYQSDRWGTRLAVATDRTVTVSLQDVNRQVRQTLTVTTNDFGSASGVFTLPADGLLGNWQITTDHDGHVNLRIEEYRRPTFEVTLLDPDEPLRLDATATVTGRADYYFGEPVTEGRAIVRVRRGVHIWRGWASLGFLGGGEMVVSDTTSIGSDGRFAVTFATTVPPSHADRQAQIVSYQVEAEVTGAGGETRFARRGFLAATVAVLGEIEQVGGFLQAGQADTLRILRTDANRVGRPGRGRWALHRVQQPDRARLLGDMTLTSGSAEAAYFATPGDSLRPRWHMGRATPIPGHGWPLGDEMASGWIEHDENGVADLPVAIATPGVYRLVYETEDDAGRTGRTTRDLLVAGDTPADIRVPLVLAAATNELPVGATARFFVHSGLPDATILVRVFVGGELWRTEFVPGTARVIEVPVTAAAHRGLEVEANLVQDHQFVRGRCHVRVPWTEKRLDVVLGTFRDRLRPGETERFTVTVTGQDAAPVLGELLAWMVDRRLDAIAPPRRFDPLSLYARRWSMSPPVPSLGRGGPIARLAESYEALVVPTLQSDRLKLFPGTDLHYTLDHRGRLQLAVLDSTLLAELAADGIDLLPAIDVGAARYMVEVKNATSYRTTENQRFERYAIDSVEQALALEAGIIARAGSLHVRGGRSGEVLSAIDVEQTLAEVEAREDFAETALFLPHVALDDAGQATIEFRVPEAVTEWRLQVAAHTRDMRAGMAEGHVRTAKDLLVRPYLPRFLREGDAAELRVVVTNASDEALAGHLQLRLEDPLTGDDRSAAFGLLRTSRPLTVAAGASTFATFAVTAPEGLGEVAVRAVATADGLSDGERRALPILPGRAHLVESRFVALQDSTRRELRFASTTPSDSTRYDEQLVITVDTQLMDGVLRALPYLIDYPHECTEQTLNRYLSTSILASVYGDHPRVAAMAARHAGRDTPLARWDQPDPNRNLRLEETPWLRPARGGAAERPLVDLLDPAEVARQRQDSLARLAQQQNADGGFPWFAGGESSWSMTLYVLMSLARGTEFGLELPVRMVHRAWPWVRRQAELPGETVAVDPQAVTLLNYVLSCYDDELVEQAGFTTDDLATMLDVSWRHRLTLSRLRQAQLALTLERAGRRDDARAIVAALLDVATDDPDLGVHWPAEDRAWLWTNDTIEGHAFILRTVSEIAPDEPRLAGLARWLLLNKKLDHWKSTRATAEAIHALVHYQQATGTLAIREEVRVRAGRHDRRFVSDPADPTAGRDRLVLAGHEIDPVAMSTIVVSKETSGLAFASATWHFSTEQPAVAADGDLFAVTRRYFRRFHDGQAWVLAPLTDGEAIAVGEQVEVQLSITARHAAEYVHLRDPRPAGCEPEASVSRHRWDLGLRYYQEIRDSGANFFFARLPAGQYTLKHRLRATVAGVFKAQPTVLQSMYAPEFTAHSAGASLSIGR